MTFSERRQHRPTAARFVSALTLAMIAAGCVSACGSAPPSVTLDNQWPDTGANFDETGRQWSRVGTLRSSFADGMTQLLEVHATVKSPAWRVAYVDYLTKRNHLSEAARKSLLEEHKKAAQEALEVELIVTTYHARHNDLQKGKRSMWRLRLATGSNGEIPPEAIIRDNRPRRVLAAEFRGVNDFSEAYVARFPNPDQILGAGSDRITLSIASTLGGVELVWQSR